MVNRPEDDIPPPPTIEEAKERLKHFRSFVDGLTDEQLAEYFRISKELEEAGVPEVCGDPTFEGFDD